MTAPSDIITATDLEAAGYDVAWAQLLPIPTHAAGEPFWLRSDLDPWLRDEGDAS